MSPTQLTRCVFVLHFNMGTFTSQENRTSCIELWTPTRCTFLSIEIAKQSECIIQMDGNMTTITKPDAEGQTKSFSFDHSYWSFDKKDPNYAGQQRLYDDLGVELLNHSFNGYNTCIVACKFVEISVQVTVGANNNITISFKASFDN